jgi:hypothetical protein
VPAYSERWTYAPPSTPIHRLLSVQMQRATDDKSEPPRQYTPDAAFTRARGEISSEATAHVHVQAEKLMASDGAAWLGGSAAAHLQIVHGTCLAPSCHSNASTVEDPKNLRPAATRNKSQPRTVTVMHGFLFRFYLLQSTYIREPYSSSRRYYIST